MNCLSTKIPNFCSCDLVKTGKVNVICMVAFCQFICLYNTLYCGLFRQSVIAIRTMLLVKINGGLGCGRGNCLSAFSVCRKCGSLKHGHKHYDRQNTCDDSFFHSTSINVCTVLK